MKKIETVTVIGAGAMAWGIAYIIASYKKAEVRIWDRNQAVILEAKEKGINSKNSNPEIKMPKDVLFFTNLEESLEHSDLILLGVPSFAVREICQKINNFSVPPILMISKGMEKDTSLLPFQIVEEVLKTKDILHITGAGYGKEVHKKIPATECLVSRNENLLKEVKKIIETEWLTIETSADLLGVQLAGSLKNVIVIGIGMVLGNKENPELRNKLINEGVQEMMLLGKEMGAQKESFLGAAGKGDLEISSDPLSRNYKLGQSIAETTIEQVQKELTEKGITVEGFHTAWAAYQLSKKHGVRLPIIKEIYKVIYENKNPEISITELIKLTT